MRTQNKYFHTYIHTYILTYAAEFRLFFEHVRALRFDDRPDYDYLKRLFRELFFRKGFTYDNLYDWEIIQQVVASSSRSVCMVWFSFSYFTMYVCML